MTDKEAAALIATTPKYDASKMTAVFPGGPTGLLMLHKGEVRPLIVEDDEDEESDSE